ncbi:hypothetical protein LOTGIDRAFT_173642 [Lottia gigantea]|uniref:Uncharacterized protein n=1 Tax=Lottia gigantea TaxID=225164 RepID=V4A6S3_LOTGI|nr:hypothetical protein LOTGIDRAFT_173642 [Lottia gigantea]ESO99633.1 hypothetical protein LOTGIDRAFT_173642 [Lottia gigantea]
MKPEILVSPNVITVNGKKISITKKLIDKYKYCNVRDEIDLERTDANVWIFSSSTFDICWYYRGECSNSGISDAVGAANNDKAAAVKAANEKKAAAVKAADERRHNLTMEKLAAEGKKPNMEKKGSGVADILGTVKEFGKRFGEETKKTVKQGLNSIIDKIDTAEMKVKHKGNGIFFKNIRNGEGLFLTKYKGDGVILNKHIE